MVAGVFSVRVTPTTRPLSVGHFCAAPPGSHGNVGVSLSGGGSRALTAGIGQLRALKKLTANGRSLLAQTKALSTVSGGAWLGVPFVYLPPGSPSDDAYLGPWIDDQSVLTPAMLVHLPAGNAGVPISSPLFSPRLLAVQALLLYAVLQVPPDILWQTIVGLNILASYGLYAPTARLTPTDTLSFNAETAASQVTNPNPALVGAPIEIYADAANSRREHRPFLICNSAMFLTAPGSTSQLLAPVQSTPFITGVFGTPAGEDANGRRIGGGGIDSFGFNSACASMQRRQRRRRAGATMVADGRGGDEQRLLRRGAAEPVPSLAAGSRGSRRPHGPRSRYHLALDQDEAASRGARCCDRPFAPRCASVAYPGGAASLRAIRPAGRHPALPVLVRARPAARHAVTARPLRGWGNLENTVSRRSSPIRTSTASLPSSNSSVPMQPAAYGVADGAWGGPSRHRSRYRRQHPTAVRLPALWGCEAGRECRLRALWPGGVRQASDLRQQPGFRAGGTSRPSCRASGPRAVMGAMRTRRSSRSGLR